MINNTTSVRELLDIAKRTVQNEVLPGEEFIVKGLFREFEWNRLPTGCRIQIGSLFMYYVQNESDGQIIPINKNARNQQVYKKIR